jgi:hypothetical protein
MGLKQTSLPPYTQLTLFEPHDTYLSLVAQKLPHYLQFACCSLRTPNHLYQIAIFGIMKMNINAHG